MRSDPEPTEVRDRRPGRRGPRRRPAHRPRADRDAGLHPAGDQGDGARARVARGRGARLRADPRQHLPPVRLAGAGADRRRRRPARVHGLGAGADHRLRRLPGLLARPRRRRRTRSRAAAAPAASHGSKVEISEEGARFRSYRDGAELFISPEVSMQVQAALGSDIALVFDECTPFHADRDYTARSTERTHRWLDRCLDWHEREGPARQAVFGIVQGGSTRTCAANRPRRSSAAGVDGIAIGGTLGRDKEEMAAVLAMTAPLLPGGGAQAPARHRRGRRPARRASPSASTSSTAPSRPASPATASPSRPTPRPASASTCARPAGSATATRSSRAAPARPARATTATTSATSRAPRS